MSAGGTPSPPPEEVSPGGASFEKRGPFPLLPCPQTHVAEHCSVAGKGQEQKGDVRESLARSSRRSRVPRAVLPGRPRTNLGSWGLVGSAPSGCAASFARWRLQTSPISRPSPSSPTLPPWSAPTPRVSRASVAHTPGPSACGPPGCCDFFTRMSPPRSWQDSWEGGSWKAAKKERWETTGLLSGIGRQASGGRGKQAGSHLC